MDTKEALAALSHGHDISPAYAEEICKALGVGFEKSLIQVFAGDRHVYSLRLADHVASCLGIKDKARGFIGRGSQAQEYARVVAEKLAQKRA